MKVILLQDVAKIGRKHQIVDVPSGYAQNQLIPKGMAKPATPENLKAAERIKTQNSAELEKSRQRFLKAKEILADKTIVIKNQKNDNGHLFAAIKSDQILAALEQEGVVVDPAMIKILKPIKMVGEHEVLLTSREENSPFKIAVE